MIVVGHDLQTGNPLVTGDDCHALVLGPPRSGKTTGKLVPSILTHRGPVVVASSKRDVFDLTVEHRLADGPVWVFAITPGDVPQEFGVRRAAWSPVTGCRNWDSALLRARSLTTAEPRQREDESSRFFRSLAERLLAALLHAAALAGHGVEDVTRWLLLGDLSEPSRILTAADATWARIIVTGFDVADARLRDSILVTACDTMRVYDSEFARRQAEGALIDIGEFLRADGTIYVIAPSDVQQQFAALVVGLLDDVRRTTYSAFGPGRRTVLCVLDEADKIAPWPALPGVLGEGGSQGFQLLVCVQDLSQARTRWGAATDGFGTLFRHKVLLGGIADARTLESFSAVLGEEHVPGSSHTATRPLWPPHRLASLPPDTAVHIDGVVARHVSVVRAHQVGRAPSARGRR